MGFTVYCCFVTSTFTKMHWLYVAFLCHCALQRSPAKNNYVSLIFFEPISLTVSSGRSVLSVVVFVTIVASARASWSCCFVFCTNPIIDFSTSAFDFPHPRSRRHARIFADADGGFYVEDYGSTHGTFVAGSRLTAPVRLFDGLRVAFGSSSFEYRFWTVSHAV